MRYDTIRCASCPVSVGVYITTARGGEIVAWLTDKQQHRVILYICRWHPSETNGPSAIHTLYIIRTIHFCIYIRLGMDDFVCVMLFISFAHMLTAV